MMNLPLAQGLTFGFQGRMETPDQTLDTITLAERYNFSWLTLGDHLSFAVPVLDPLIQMAAAAALTRKVGMLTAVYLLPLRHPAAVAKQVATLDRMTEGRLIFGVGIGGEFASDYEVVGVPIHERGARLSEGIQVLRKLWTGEKVRHEGRFYSFRDIQMLPAPVQPGGPPIWVGGRSDSALRRAGELGDGYISYVVTPDMFQSALEKIALAAGAAKRPLDKFGTAHVLFVRMGKNREEALEHATKHLSIRYAMDFRRAAGRYCALGRPADVAETLRQFHVAGVRTMVIDIIGEPPEQDDQLRQFAEEVMPLVAALK
ncbi:MAG: LLM class flavin-dependent oxidoreductase [Burkholderiales bacterium]